MNEKDTLDKGLRKRRGEELWIDCPNPECKVGNTIFHMIEQGRTSIGILFECDGCERSYLLKQGELYERVLRPISKNEWHFWKP